uniref:EGF-like-domain, multiple 6 n=1 Tax=Paramormyrops kingsleyae TaxID=1676925 RepID=A0A3B3Q9V1_9TELE|nr:epidermal growth factor-like protein 6 [Paramormyrops kingsleyae]
MLVLAWLGALALLVKPSTGTADLYRQASPDLQTGLCHYGHKMDCCYGWERNSKGQCTARCERGCEHGECVGPNKCRCLPGYTGKSCSQDANECGLKPRPCPHRCMNTPGSYVCYCPEGQARMADGSCFDSRTCALAHCQYGCEEVHGEPRCHCPSTGLQLSPDGKTCVDIDECTSRKILCPHNRRCVNTFGSYYCKCKNGYDLKYVKGKYDCVDADECADGTHKCSQNSVCLNTQGSYKCRCKHGFRGNGISCTAIRDPTIKFPRILGGSKLVKNAILKPSVTMPGVVRQPEVEQESGNPTEPQELDDIHHEKGEKKKDEEDRQQKQMEGEQLRPRGDVFFSEELQSVFGPAMAMREMPITPGQEEFIMDCSFDHGACEWLQDQEDDFDWSVIYHSDGQQYYMAVNGLLEERKHLARLKLLLTDRMQQAGFCLTFSFRVMGDQAGVLRVLLHNNTYPVWEQQASRNQTWQMELLTVAWEENPPRWIIFEAERGVGGEIGLDNVVITSGACQAVDPDDL